MVFINTAIRNQTDTSEDETITVDLSSFMESSRSAQVKRMTSPGADSKNSDTATWAGQAFTNGTASGPEMIERIDHGKVTVRGSEAVLVTF